MSAGAVRSLLPDDAAAARALIAANIGPRYRMRVVEQLDAALAGDDAECRGMVALQQAVGGVSGLLLAGVVAGAAGVVKLHALIGRDRPALLTLLDALVASCAERAVRMIVCELADDPSLAMFQGVVLERGFAREGRLDDFFADGVALDLMVWRA